MLLYLFVQPGSGFLRLDSLVVQTGLVLLGIGLFSHGLHQVVLHDIVAKAERWVSD